MTQEVKEADYYTDSTVLVDPYPWFEGMRAKGKVAWMENRKLVFVSDYENAVAIMNNNQDWSNAISPSGPLLPLPFETAGVDDITDLIEAHRSEIPLGEMLASRDGVPHVNSRALISRLFTPSRLREMETYMVDLADRMVGELVAKGRCELINELASPFVTYVVSDLLGVPAEDRETFRELIDAAPPPSAMENAPPPGKEREYAERAKQKGPSTAPPGPLEIQAGYFYRYLSERRAQPRDDVMSEFAQATYPDGTQPDIAELVRLSAFLFGAGQDTSAKLIGNAFRYLVDIPGLQQQLRDDRKLIAPFIEEVLRLEGSVKTAKRLAKRAVRVGDMDIEPGQIVVVGIAAANRDPERWEAPNEFRLNRPRVKEHLSFGRGSHTCAGAPLARVEVRIVFEKLLEHTSHVDLAADKHGTPDNRIFDWEPSYNMRGLSELHAELTPAK